jgi:hypothetical protein
VIVFPATAPSSRNGLGYDQELIKRISAASGKPATTASTALLKALRVLSAKRIVLGAPWSVALALDFLDDPQRRLRLDVAQPHSRYAQRDIFRQYSAEIPLLY